MSREREPLASLVLYHLFKWSVVAPMFYGYFRGRVYGAENVPASQPLLVVSNHASYFDPPLLSCCVRRPVAYMAKQDLFDIPVFRQAITLYGAYPVRRGVGDRAAIRAAIQALQQGWAAGIFLQGNRTSDGQITAPKLGAAMIAAKAGVPILPVSLWGTEKILAPGSALPRPVPVTVRIGKPMSPPTSTQRDVLQTFSDRCAEVINQMHLLGR